MSKIPIVCRCGRKPEVNTFLREWSYSLICKCGTNEIQFATWSNDQERVADNWESLINETPPKHYVQHLPTPNARVQLIAVASYDNGYDTDPLRQQIRATGGHCSGGAGCC